MSSDSTKARVDALGLPDDYRPRQYAPTWETAPADWQTQLAEVVARPTGSSSVFFRADDIGAGGRAFDALCHLFRHYQVPLAMAVVPAWLSEVRRQQLFEAVPLDEPLWDWHQHGWRHVNWQRTGKKSEFGEHRPFEKQWRDIWQGQQKMRTIFGERLIEIFTPPWNRLSHSTLRILHELGYRGVSLAGPFPRGCKIPGSLVNLRVQLDLHTRKPKDGQSDFPLLLDELGTCLARREPFGIMIHHQRMTTFAFEFLNELLYLLQEKPRVTLVSIRTLLDRADGA